MFQKVSVNLNRLRFPASLKSFFSIGYYCMQRKAITNCFIFQVNNIAFHPVHCCLLATVGSDGKFSFWDKDARTKLKVCTHLYFGRLDARPVICFYTPYGIVSFCRSLKFYHTQQDWTWNIKQIFFHEQAQEMRWQSTRWTAPIQPKLFNVSIHILHTLLCTSHLVLMRRIYSTITTS